MTTRIFIVLSTAAALLAPSIAQARKSSLAEAPAVRKKYEYRTGRIEVTPTFEGSVGAQYQHTLSGGVLIEYHLSDSLSIGGSALFGANISTGLYDEIHSSLPTDPTTPLPQPTQSQADHHVNKMPIHGSLHATFTPTFGKMAFFGKSFIAYDIYFFGGFGFAQTNNSYADQGVPNSSDDTTICEDTSLNIVPCSDPGARGRDPRNDGPHNEGFNPGVAFGGGLHVYFNRWVALDLSLRNYMFSDNPSGLDFDHDLDVDADDRRFMSHLFVGVGVSLFLPPKAKISR
jgi:outer membrane beta-barrel protein